TRNIGTHLRELGSVAEKRGAIVTGEQPLHLPPDGDVERAQQRVRQRPPPRPRRCRLGTRGERHHAAPKEARSVFGTGTAASTLSRIASGLTSSASAWCGRPRRWRRASFASACRSSAST